MLPATRRIFRPFSLKVPENMHFFSIGPNYAINTGGLPSLLDIVKNRRKSPGQIQFCSSISDHSASSILLEKKWFRLDPTDKQLVTIKFQQGKNGQKHFRFNQWDKTVNTNAHFPNIPLPQDAYSFVGGMDKLVEELLAENLGEKLSSNISPNDRIVELACTQFNGIIYDYQLDLFLFNNGRGRNKIGFQMQTIQSVQQHRGRWLLLPFRALPWLRHEMAGMLARHDGSQQLRPAPKIPPHLFGELNWSKQSSRWRQ